MYELFTGFYFGLAISYLFFSIVFITAFFTFVKRDDKISEITLFGYDRKSVIKNYQMEQERKQIEKNNSYEKNRLNIEALALEDLSLRKPKSD
jgi:hypothetical protein